MKPIAGHIFFKAYENHATRVRGHNEILVVHVGERFVSVFQINLLPSKFDVLTLLNDSDVEVLYVNSEFVLTKEN